MKLTRKDFLLTAAATIAGIAGTKTLTSVKAASEDSAITSTQRWAMAIDFQKCRWDQGCNQCVQSCKQAHNIPDVPEKAHEVKWIWKEQYNAVFPQQSQWIDPSLASHPLMLLCNHCSNPPCTKVCPTGATWKRADGIVMMDWHRCIGCRYCMAACPYDSRSFDFVDPRADLVNINPAFPTRTKGVVEKCNFCEELLGTGQRPACVEGCHEHALIFGDLNDPASEIRSALRSRYAMQRTPELGTGPAVYYLL
jgi:molybdopterin-containing oxidoreductase family iron-sulfur binding subunit